jgi:hypothetical protein
MTFGHSGDLGDVIFALPAVRALGGGEIVLHAHPVTQSRMTKGRAESLIPLLEAQPYVTSARYTDEKNPKVDVDFNGFRVRFRPHVTLAQMQAEWVGVKVDLSQPWLERPAVPEVDIVVLSRSPRYRNNQFNWRHVVETLGEKCVFVGMPDEHQDFVTRFGFVPHYPTTNFLDIAKVIAASRAFIGNQSSPNAVAEGMKHPKCMEQGPGLTDCLFPEVAPVIS